MRYEYYFYKRSSIKLIEVLNKYQIEFKMDNDDMFNQSWVKFSIYSSSPKAEFYLQELRKINVTENYVDVEFTAKELLEAELLLMRPKRQSIDIEDTGAFQYGCRWIVGVGQERVKHEAQVKELVIKKVPPMKKNNAFWCESTGFSIIFADKRIQELAEDNSLTGIEFKSVFLKNGKCSDDFFQMTSSNILKKDCIVLGYGEKIVICPKCGKEQYEIGNVWQLHLDFSKIEKQSDLYVTERIFGGGIAEPIYVISQKFYRILVENKLNRSITFYPVINVTT